MILQVLNRAFAVMALILILSCCSTVPKSKPGESGALPEDLASKVLKADATYPIDAYDPLEGLNRRIYYFNAKFDKYIFLPVVRGYEFITPSFVQAGISNFFANLREITTLASTLLQIKGEKAAKTTGRIVINTTVGIGGLFDPATSWWGLTRETEDFGQTLGFYRVCPGPYLILPILGPSTVRDTAGLVVDAALDDAVVTGILNQMDMETGEEDKLKAALILLNAIDTRHRLAFRYYQTGSPFEYELVRLLYLKKRELDIDK